MNAVSIIAALTTAKASATKLETATKVMASLKEMRGTKGMPQLAIRRAIRMQEKTLKTL